MTDKSRNVLFFAVSLAISVGINLYRAYKSSLEGRKSRAEIKRLELEIEKLKSEAIERRIQFPTAEQVAGIDVRTAELARLAEREDRMRAHDITAPILIPALLIYIVLTLVWWIMTKLFLK